MNEIRKFRVLKDMKVNVGVFQLRTIPSETILNLRDLGTVNGFNSFWCSEYNFMIRDIKSVVSLGYIKEILPDEKPNLTESENPYGRQIYLAEAIHALTNHDVLIKDKYGYIWDYDKIDETFYTYDDNKDTIIITDKYTLKEILEFQFDVVPKPVEEVKEKWVRIKSRAELFNKIREGKKIKEYRMTSDGKAQAKIYFTNGHEIHDDIWNIFGKFENTNYFVDYLEE